MKNRLVLSIIIPAYNAEKHLDVSLPSILNERLFNEGVMSYYEVIIVNDGSTDQTSKSATDWAQKWNAKTEREDFVRVVNKKNGQYGSVVNLAITLANGDYFKLLDADDHFLVDAFIEFIYITLSLEKNTDAIITDHIFEKVDSDKTILNSYIRWLTPNSYLDLNKVSLPPKLITIHSLIYRTEFLREIKFKQIEGIYYSDTQLAVIPLLKAHKIYYSQISLYGYYIGRDDQSINLSVMLHHINDQKKVTSELFSSIPFEAIENTLVAEYAFMILQSMLNWHLYLITEHPKIKNKRSASMVFLKEMKAVQPKWFKRVIFLSLPGFIWLTKGMGISNIYKYGKKLYVKIKPSNTDIFS